MSLTKRKKWWDGQKYSDKTTNSVSFIAQVLQTSIFFLNILVWLPFRMLHKSIDSGTLNSKRDRELHGQGQHKIYLCNLQLNPQVWWSMWPLGQCRWKYFLRLQECWKFRKYSLYCQYFQSLLLQMMYFLHFPKGSYCLWNCWEYLSFNIVVERNKKRMWWLSHLSWKTYSNEKQADFLGWFESKGGIIGYVWINECWIVSLWITLQVCFLISS